MGALCRVFVNFRQLPWHATFRFGWYINAMGTCNWERRVLFSSIAHQQAEAVCSAGVHIRHCYHYRCWNSQHKRRYFNFREKTGTKRAWTIMSELSQEEVNIAKFYFVYGSALCSTRIKRFSTFPDVSRNLPFVAFREDLLLTLVSRVSFGLYCLANESTKRAIVFLLSLFANSERACCWKRIIFYSRMWVWVCSFGAWFNWELI